MSRIRENDVFIQPICVTDGTGKESSHLGLFTRWIWHVKWGYGLPESFRSLRWIWMSFRQREGYEWDEKVSYMRMLDK